MSLPDLIALTAGILVEVLLLWEASGQAPATQAHPRLLAPQLSRIREAAGWTILIAALLVLLFQTTGFKPGSVILDAFSNVIMLVSFSFLFVFGMVAPSLMPRISEQTVVLVNLLVVMELLPQMWQEPLWLSLIAIPSGIVLLLALSSRSLHPILKSFVYLWYLICLLMLAVRNNFELFFDPGAAGPAGPFEFALAGAAGIFLLLHAIFLVRFFLMLSALVLPVNRQYIISVMPQLFSDEQLPRLRFLGLLGLLAALSLANHFLGFAPQTAFTNLLVLAAVQLFDRFPSTASLRL